MSFDLRDLHRPLDVFSRDNVYLGTILRVAPAPSDGANGSATPGQVLPSPLQSSQVNGELLGPMPTAPLGNPGPETQSARHRYRSDRDGAPAVDGSIVVGRWWGIRGRRTIPLDQILSLSFERVILKPTYAELRR